MYVLPVFVLVTVRVLLLHSVYCARVPLVQWFSMASTDRVPIGPYFYSYCSCTIARFAPCLYLLYSSLVWPVRVTYVLPVFVLVTVSVLLHRVYCARVPLVQWFRMASTGRVPVGPCFSSCCDCTIAHRVLCLCLMYSVLRNSGMANPGDVSIFPVFVLVLCMYHCTVCTVLVPFVHVCVCVISNIKFVEGFSHSFPSSNAKSNFVY